MSVIQDLKERHVIHQLTSPQIENLMETPKKIYMGIDPTGDLHIGHLVGLNICQLLKRAGHTIYILIGTATALIGDPSGKSQERVLLDDKTVRRNADIVRSEIDKFFAQDKGSGRVEVVENGEWFTTINMIEFLRDIGKYFRIGKMLGKESVKARMDNEEGMSYTEFSYQLLQAYDFYHMKREHGVEIQIGGTDQWGNIVAGIEFAAKKGVSGLYGFTFSLLTKSDGTKFGKTEEGALWLDPKKCSPETVYQYMYKTSDDDVLNVMRLLTDVSTKKILDYQMQREKDGVEPNFLQKILAKEVVTKIHGKDAADKAYQEAQALAVGKKDVDLEDIELLLTHIKLHTKKRDEWLGKKYIELFLNVGLVESKGEIKKLIKQAGASVNNKPIDEPETVIKMCDLHQGKYLLLAKGKKKKICVELIV